MSFQAEVGAFLAVQMLANAQVGQRFHLNHFEQIVSLRMESGNGVDDVVATLSGGGKVSIQCKTSLSISEGEKADFSKTVGQFVEELVAAPSLDPAGSALAIAVPMGTAAPLDTLQAACARVGAGGLPELANGSEAEREAFAKLKTCADRAYQKLAPGVAPDYRRLAQLLRIVRFDRGPTGSMRVDGAALLGRALYGGDAAGSAPFTTMVDAIREAIKTGHPLDRQQLLGELRRRGHVDTHVPGYDGDLGKIAADTNEELDRLRRFGRLPLGDYQLARPSQAALFEAVKAGSLLVIGEPGAGKSGALGILADEWSAIGPTMILSVDRFAGIVQTRQLSDELRLDHDLVDVLEAWPGDRPGLLIIDALDAARGGQAEAIFVNLVERVAKLAPRWRIAASVRTFDLLNGQRLRALLPGSPPSPDHADAAASTTRHFLVPALSGLERERLASDRPMLAGLLNSSNAKLAALLINIFNLSLAADLVANGTPASSFEGVATQSDLIDQYEDRRLPNKAARSAMIAAVAKMVDIKNLTLRTAELDHSGLEDLLGCGILIERDDRYGFAHHILFDHVAGRYFIDAESSPRLIAQLKALGGKAFMLAPALRFALERFWRRDTSAKRNATWKLLLVLAQQRDLGPIAAASALRTAAEQVQSTADLEGLDDEIAVDSPQPLNRTLFQLARFVAMKNEAGHLASPAATAWAGFAERIALRGEKLFVEPARFLLMPLATADNLGDPTFLVSFGKAARAGLAAARAAGDRYNHARSSNIDFIGQSYSSDIDASRAALEPFLASDWLTKYGHQDATPLARALRFIVPLDPAFAGEIFSAILNQPIPSDAKTDMSGSRILGLTSTEAQDFKHSFFYLRKAFGTALAQAPDHTPSLLSIASLAKRARKADGAPEQIVISVAGEPDVTILLDGLDLFDWRQKREHGDPADVEIPQAFADHVATAGPAELEAIVRAAKNGNMASSVWRRLLGGQIDTARRGPVDTLLWPIAANPAVVESSDLGRDAIDFLRAVYPTVTLAEREAFERAVATHAPADRRRWKLMLNRLVTALPVTHLATAGMKRRRTTLEKSNALEGNPADYSFYTPHGRVLRPSGNKTPRTKIEAACAKIEKAVASYREQKTADRLAPIWRAIADARSDEDSSNLGEMIAHLATEMAVDDARSAAIGLIEKWTASTPIHSDRLCDVAQMLRGRFFYSYLPDSDERKAFGSRARQIGHATVRASATQMTEAKSRLEALPDESPDRDELVGRYHGGNRALDQIVTQLYFGSGSNKDAGPTDISLNSADQKLAFFADWSEPLLAAESVATPHTIKYLLEIYEHLLDADPPRFFERIGNFICGPAAAEYYQTEQLAAGDLVKFVRHMLADHRSLFDDDAQRDRLIAILDVFADEGWPEAMRLLWELPDLLR